MTDAYRPTVIPADAQMQVYVPMLIEHTPIRVGRLIETRFRDCQVEVLSIENDNDDLVIDTVAVIVRPPASDAADRTVERERIYDRLIVAAGSHVIRFFEMKRELVPDRPDESHEVDQPIGHEPKGQVGG